MRCEWKTICLNDAVSKLGDGLHGTPKYDEFGEYFFINGNNLVNGEIAFKDAKRVTFAEYEKYKKELNDRTILVSINGTLGNVAVYKSEKCILGKSACYLNVRDDFDKNFIRYVVSTSDFQEYIRRFANGTTIKNVSLKVMRDYTFECPDLDTQRTIAATLSVLDDKIALNTKINRNLEQMAQAIFVELCSEGKNTVLSDILTVCYGKDHKRLGEGTIPCYGSGGIMRCVDEALYNGESVLIPRKGSLNNVLYVNEPFWTVDTMFYTHMTRSNVAKFVYFTVRSLDLAGMNVGSAVPSMTTTILNSLEIVLPSDDILASFEEKVNPMFLQIQANNTESARLAAIRDALLPKLMSGEIKSSEEI